jgi:ABC-type dipeptide/oligopeptide/nickel transport system ATPase component
MAKETLLEIKNLVTEFRTEEETVKAVNNVSFTLHKRRNHWYCWRIRIR